MSGFIPLVVDWTSPFSFLYASLLSPGFASCRIMGFVIPAHIMPSLALYSSDVDYCVSLDRELYLFRSRRCSVTTIRPINWDAKAAPGS